MVTEKAPALCIIEEDVQHCAVHVSDLTAICPKFHAAQQRHTSIPRILEGQIKVTATASHLSWSLCPLPWAAPQTICNVSCVFAGFYVYCTKKAL